MKKLLFIILLTLIGLLSSQTFTDIEAGLPGVCHSSTSWGDYDNDGDLDILLTGYSGNYESKIFRNDSGVFTDIEAGLQGIYSGSVAWGDYDNDGDLDILLTGISSSVMDFKTISKIYRNDSGVFTDIEAGLQSVYSGSVAWGDYDNDGDLDILLTGNNNSIIYRNDSGDFTNIHAGLTGVSSSSATWGDYDNDGDLDILITGDTGSSSISKIYSNNSGIFTEIAAGLEGVDYGCVALGDYDNDGDLDIVLTGYTSSERITKIYRNNSGVFNDINAGLQGAYNSSVAWADYDNDGDLDILLTGSHYDGTTHYESKIYRNDSGVFADTNTNLIGVAYSSVSWGDYDNDSDLDILLTGMTDSSYVTKVYRNDCVIQNTAPNSPINLSIVMNDMDVVFSWDKATDNETPQDGLSYNLYIGSAPMTGDVNNSMIDETNGYRKIVNIGNAGQNTSWTIKNLPVENYYWSVQAIDHTFAGSEFAEEKMFYNGFTDIEAEIIGVSSSCSVWGDYDGDADLDLLISGYVYNSGQPFAVTKIYRNDNNSFVDIESNLPSVCWSSAAWGDYDNDGDLDLVLSGRYYDDLDGVTSVYRNDDGSFVDIGTNLVKVAYGSCDWGDYDNDGLLDLLITGMYYDTDYNWRTRVYRNTGTDQFIDISAEVENVGYSSGAWGDYDNDGDLDILIEGTNGTNSYISKIYENSFGKFIDINADLEHNFNGTVSWGDYDNDGDLDILSVGRFGYYIYENDYDEFELVNSGLKYYDYKCSGSWGDYDNDGDLDIVITGGDDSNCFTKIYQNTEGTFIEIDVNFIGSSRGSNDWGDYDNDGDLDLIITGYSDQGYNSLIYRNNIPEKNNSPVPPSNFLYTNIDSVVTFNWDKATDTETLQDGLSYNFYLGTEPLSGNVNSSMSDTESGYRQIVSIGNCGQNTFCSIKNLSEGTYYWAVQAIDHGFAGSEFSEEQNFVFYYPPLPPLALKASNIAEDSFQANWESVDGAIGYYIDIAKDSLFTDYLSGYSNLDLGNTLTLVVDGYSLFTDYYYRLKSYNVHGSISESSNIIFVNSLQKQFTEMDYDLSEYLNSKCAWGDYDNDGDLDLLVTGRNVSGMNNSIIYRNDSGIFTDINAGLIGVYLGSSCWGDYDNDGYLDVFINGLTRDGPISKLYKNIGNDNFSDTNFDFFGAADMSAWGDYDNDGDLDLILTGYFYDGSTEIYLTKLYNNNSGYFSEINAEIAGVSSSALAWGDYDNDGDWDLIISGNIAYQQRSTTIYRNEGNEIFIDTNSGLVEASDGSVCWGDYDNDGDLDLLLTGNNIENDDISKVYRNDGNDEFHDIDADLIGVRSSSAVWGDYDNDGDLDILLSGSDPDYNKVSIVYRYEGNDVFSKTYSSLTGISLGSAVWGDYDNDGDLDILITGSDNSSNSTSIIYRNNSIIKNTSPNPPSNLSTTITDSTLTFHWNKATDNETPQDGLSYNLYIRTDSLECNINSPMSNTENGYRKVVNLGNAGQNTSWTINNLPDGRYYWSVQAIDHSFAGSEFAEEQSVYLLDLSTPNNVKIRYSDAAVNISWDSVPNATSYKIFASDEPLGNYTDMSSTGIFYGMNWKQYLKPNMSKKFYHVVAVIE